MKFIKSFFTNPFWLVLYAIIVLSIGPQLISSASWLAFGLGVLLFVVLVFWIIKVVQKFVINQIKESNE